MTFSDLASIGSFISAVAVVASLVYLGSQVRQARQHQQAAIRAERASRLAMMNTAAEDPSIAEAVMKGLQGAEDLTVVQYAQFSHFCRASFFNAEDTYFQHAEGLLSEQAFASFIANVKGWAAGSPGIRAGWTQSRSMFVSEFADWMDRTLAEVEPAPPPDRFAEWRSLVAAQRVGG